MLLDYSFIMETIKIKKDFKNELFKRQELNIELESENNPSFAEIKKQVAEKVGKPEENIDVLRIKGGFGKNVFNVEVYVYDSKESLDEMVELRKTQKQKKKDKEEASKPKEEVKDETLAEEKQEEKSTEAPVKDETPVEDKSEEQEKETKEEEEKKEESKE